MPIDPAALVARVLEHAGWTPAAAGGFTLVLPRARLTAGLEPDGRLRLDCTAREGEAVEAVVSCSDTLERFLEALPSGASRLEPAELRTYLRVLLDQGACAAVDVLESGRWLPLAASIALQEEGARGLVSAVLGAAGWEAARVDVEGQPGPVAVRQHTNAHGTVTVAPRDENSFVLLVERRSTLQVFVRSSSRFHEGDHLPDMLNLLIAFQDRLGEPAADRVFWRALCAFETALYVLRAGAQDSAHDRSMFDWSLLDAHGALAADVAATPPLKVGFYTLTAATDFRRLARETLEGHGLATTHQRDVPFAVDALFTVDTLLEGTPYRERLAEGVASCLAHPAVEIRAQALFFFQNGRTGLAAAEQVEEVAAAQPALFVGVPDPVHWGDLTLTEGLRAVFAARARAGSGRAAALLATLPPPQGTAT